MALLPSPSALVELTRYAVGQVVETAASVATVPVRVLGLLGQTELLVSRMTVLAERAEGLIARVDGVVGRVDGVVGGIEATLRETKVIMAAAALAVDEAGAVAARAALVVDGAAETVDGAAGAVSRAGALVDEAGRVAGAADGVVRQASALSGEAHGLLDGYAPTLRRAAPLAARFIDELPRLRQHLSEDVMPLLGKLDQVGPDLHSLLEVTNDLHLAIAGLPGLKMLRRRGEAKEAEDDATNGR